MWILSVTFDNCHIKANTYIKLTTESFPDLNIGQKFEQTSQISIIAVICCLNNIVKLT